MKRITLLILTVFFLLSSVQCSSGGFLDDLLKQATKPQENKEDTFIAGLKEALDIGTKNAVSTVSKENGYFGNMNIKIPVPEKLKDAEKLLRKIGMKDRVDEFILSMNRAAETAAPQAADIFVGAIRDMTVVDAYGIVKGDETAATSYFKDKTSNQLEDYVTNGALAGLFFMVGEEEKKIRKDPAARVTKLLREVFGK
jgi:hypothetical protein